MSKKEKKIFLKLFIKIFNYFFRKIFKNKKIKLPEFLFLVGTAFFPQMNVELIIRFKNKKTLYLWRDDEFGNNGWHLPGGIIRPNENINKRIKEVLLEETNLSPKWIKVYGPISFSEIIYSIPKIRSHFNSLVYLIEVSSHKINIKELKNNENTLITKNIPNNLIDNHKRYIGLLKKETSILKRNKLKISKFI